MKYMKKVGSPVDMENLPCDVLSNIFIRLLAKQVAQMRCVCKSWNALLSGSSFVKSHLNHSIHNNDEILLFFMNGDTFDSNRHGPSTARPSRYPDIELTNIMKLKLRVDSQHKKASVIGSVNGLICFSYRSYQDDIVIRIWNPSLSACLTIPPPSLSQNAIQLRFGFDPKADDYKVVKLASFFRETNMVVSQPQCEVYSMRKGSWDSISQRIPSHIKLCISHQDVCIDGHLHWLCEIDLEWKPQTIVTFDLDAMTYGEIPLPDSLIHRYMNVLGVLGGKLCVMSPVTYGRCEYDVWVMDDDESWVKHHVFSQFNCCINPYRFTSRNEFLFWVDYGCFALYDPIADKTKIFKIKQAQKFDTYYVTEYVDSLVWIAPAGQFKLAA